MPALPIAECDPFAGCTTIIDHCQQGDPSALPRSSTRWFSNAKPDTESALTGSISEDTASADMLATANSDPRAIAHPSDSGGHAPSIQRI